MNRNEGKEMRDKGKEGKERQRKGNVLSGNFARHHLEEWKGKGKERWESRQSQYSVQKLGVSQEI